MGVTVVAAAQAWARPHRLACTDPMRCCDLSQHAAFSVATNADIVHVGTGERAQSLNGMVATNDIVETERNGHKIARHRMNIDYALRARVCRWGVFRFTKEKRESGVRFDDNII